LIRNISCFAMMPFAFKDHAMEHKYREHFMASNLDRYRPIVFFGSPIILAMRMFPILYAAYDHSNIDRAVLAGAIFKFVGSVIFVAVFIKKWDNSSKSRIGRILFWTVRFGWLLALYGQIRGQSDAQALTSFAALVTSCGLTMPSFTEYICCALLASYARPLQLCWKESSISPADFALIQQILYQHTLILALGISLIGSFHSDFRRNWLRSSNSPPESSTLQPATNTKLGSELAARSGSWDLLKDGYYSDADRRKLCAEVLLVCSLLSSPSFKFVYQAAAAAAAGAGRYRATADRPTRYGAAVASSQHHHRRWPNRLRVPGASESRLVRLHPNGCCCREFKG
jgi:hypothetical protein